MDQNNFETLSSLRIYLKRGDNKKGKTFWQRFFEKPLSEYLIQQAFKEGVLHASLNLGYVGYTKSAKGISYDNSEISPTTLPVCVELIAPKSILEDYVTKNTESLQNLILILVDGIRVKIPGI